MADMNLAQRALEESNLGRTRALLLRYRAVGKFEDRNPNSQTDLRGWEWPWLWQQSRTHERATLTGASNHIHAVALSADGRWLAALSIRDALRIWDLTSHKCVASRPDETFYRNQIVFGQGHRLFASSYETASVRIWDVPSLEAVSELRHGNPVSSIALSGDGTILAAVDTRDVKIRHAVELRELATISTEHNLSFGRVARSAASASTADVRRA